MQRPARDTLTDWTAEAAQDRRNTGWAFTAALAIHALVFSLQLPALVAASYEPPPRPVFVVKPARFKPPPPPEQLAIPEPRALRVPVPDPTPDDPEPLLPAEQPEVAVELPTTDLLFGLPTEPPPEPSRGPLRVGGNVLPPVRRYAPPARYPEIARAARIEGKVVVEAVIDATGRVTRVRVLESLPLGLDRAAVEAVERWRFEPATNNGKPVAVLYNLTIWFRLT